MRNVFKRDYYLYIIKKFIYKYFSVFIRYFYRVKLRFELFNKNEIFLVLSIGKVGSSTLYSEIKRKKKIPVYHIHYINEQGIEYAKQKYQKNKDVPIPATVIFSEEFIRCVKNKKIKYKVLSLVREPIIRKISGIFQEISLYSDNIRDLKYNEIRNELDYMFADCENELDEKWWFDSQVKKGLDIDVFSEDFVCERGYKYYSNNKNVELVLIRLENLKDVYVEALNVYGLNDIDISKSKNVGYKKFYSKSYGDVFNNYKISGCSYDVYASMPFVEKFYHDMLKETKLRWFDE